VLGAIVFGRELSRIGIEGDEGKRHWKGIRLKALGDPEPEKDEWL
jgi:hypothetical protein